jgi:hypothetical protein
MAKICLEIKPEQGYLREAGIAMNIEGKISQT